MTDNELKKWNNGSEDRIIKALAVLKSWQKLAYHNDDGTDEDSHELYEALTIMFDYINRQKAKIENLQQATKEAVSCFNRMESLYNIKRMELKVAKAEAVKEFVSMVKEHSYQNRYGDYIVDVDDIDNVMKEKVGE